MCHTTARYANQLLLNYNGFEIKRLVNHFTYNVSCTYISCGLGIIITNDTSFFSTACAYLQRPICSFCSLHG